VSLAEMGYCFRRMACWESNARSGPRACLDEPLQQWLQARWVDSQAARLGKDRAGITRV
jgi:hypothetical protein